MEQVTQQLKALSQSEFAALGAQQVAYIRGVLLADGKNAVGIFAADGRPLATAPSHEIAEALVRQNDLLPASVH